MKRIALIDGNSLINRAYYAMRNPMITREGIYTQGIFGFINMLDKSWLWRYLFSRTFLMP